MKQNMVEYLRKKYPKGTKIHIEIMEGEPQYANKDGIVEYVDDAGQIHGTWGGCALLEETDKFTVLERPKEKAYRATNIQWDVDEKEDLEELPDSMDIPQGMDEDENARAKKMEIQPKIDKNIVHENGTTQVAYDIYRENMINILKEYLHKIEYTYTEEIIGVIVETYEAKQQWNQEKTQMLTGTSTKEIEEWVHHSEEMDELLEAFGNYPHLYGTELMEDKYLKKFDKETLDNIEKTLFEYDQGIIKYDHEKHGLVHVEGELVQSAFIEWYEGMIDTESLISEYGCRNHEQNYEL